MDKTEKTVHSILVNIQDKLKVEKKRQNKFAGFAYRNCEDILGGIKPLLDGATLVINDEMIAVGTRHYIKATATLQYGAESISASAVAREGDSQKGMSDGQLSGATSSYARKYALGGLFIIDDGIDLDHDSQTVKTPQKSTSKPYSKPYMATQSQASEFLSDAEIPVIDSDSSMLGRAKGIIQAKKNREATVAEVKQLEALGSKQLKIWVEDQEKRLLNGDWDEVPDGSD